MAERTVAYGDYGEKENIVSETPERFARSVRLGKSGIRRTAAYFLTLAQILEIRGKITIPGRPRPHQFF